MKKNGYVFAGMMLLPMLVLSLGILFVDSAIMLEQSMLNNRSSHIIQSCENVLFIVLSIELPCKQAVSWQQNISHNVSYPT